MSINNHELIGSNVEQAKSEKIGGKFKQLKSDRSCPQ